MLRKTLVVLRVLFVVIPVIYLSSNPWGWISFILWGPIILGVFLAFTTWIDSIDARLHPTPPVPAKTRNSKAVIVLLITIAAAAIMYWSILK